MSDGTSQEEKPLFYDVNKGLVQIAKTVWLLVLIFLGGILLLLVGGIFSGASAGVLPI